MLVTEIVFRSGVLCLSSGWPTGRGSVNFDGKTKLTSFSRYWLIHVNVVRNQHNTVKTIILNKIE